MGRAQAAGTLTSSLAEVACPAVSTVHAVLDRHGLVRRRRRRVRPRLTGTRLTHPSTPMPSTACHRSGKGPRPDFYGCALGLIVRDSRGRKLLTHRGSLPGFVSQIVMVPDADSGSAATRSFGCWVWW